MRLRLAAAALWLSASIVAPACAQPVQYQSADGMNNTPVSAATPLPVTGTINATSAATAAASQPALSAGVNNLYENLSGELYVHDTSLITAVNGQTPACTGAPTCTNYIGLVNQGQPNAGGASAWPVIGSVGLDPSQTAATTVAVNISTGATTQIVALSSGKLIYVTGGVIMAGGTGNVTLEYGTGSSCGTGTTILSGAIPLVANVGFIIPANTFVVPASNALCILTSATVQYSGALGYVQK